MIRPSVLLETKEHVDGFRGWRPEEALDSWSYVQSLMIQGDTENMWYSIH